MADWTHLSNWLISGFIGLLFGVVGTLVTYKLNRRKDDIAWEREREKIKHQWQHDIELLERQLQEKREDENKADLTKGVDNAIDTIKNLIHTQEIIRNQKDLGSGLALTHFKKWYPKCYIARPDPFSYQVLIKRLSLGSGTD